MKTYKQPQIRLINLETENLIATSGGKTIEIGNGFADNCREALSNKKGTIWGEQKDIWK